eukprot:Lithocolla_globosa_v1_NODE_1962_length_2237_cov_4.914299.p2 type:complete len:120 gc:universal NODE_1962_length_2237_cov_4.914299:1155-796(-)
MASSTTRSNVGIVPKSRISSCPSVKLLSKRPHNAAMATSFSSGDPIRIIRDNGDMAPASTIRTLLASCSRLSRFKALAPATLLEYPAIFNTCPVGSSISTKFVITSQSTFLPRICRFGG